MTKSDGDSPVPELFSSLIYQFSNILNSKIQSRPIVLVYFSQMRRQFPTVSADNSGDSTYRLSYRITEFNYESSI